MNKDLIYSIFNSIDHPKDCYTMASICRDFCKVYDNHKYNILRQFVINHLRDNDKNFMKHMGEFKKIMSTKGTKYHDLHNDTTHQIDELVITVKFQDKNIVPVDAYIKEGHPKAWIFPIKFSYMYYMFKNPLFIENNNIYLTMCATGAMLCARNTRRLHKNRFLVQKCFSYREINILLTLDEFNKLF